MISRRHFLVASTAALWGTRLRAAPSERVTIGMIGTGSHGVAMNLRNFLPQPDAQVVAVCDVVRKRMEDARDMVNQKYGNTDCAIYGDFRAILARRDIDAVMISTPDHWHVPISLMAMRAGKDVICEKPTLTIEEGRVQSDAVRRFGKIFQTSTEDRSLYQYHRIAEIVRNGRIGKLQRIEVGLPTGDRGAGDPTPQPVPNDFDYEMWLGPAPWAPYCEARCHWNFRWIFDYSGGILTDWGAHLLDTAQWGNDTERTGPISVEGTGKRLEKGLYDTFYDFELRYRYANGVEMTVDDRGVKIRFTGTDGWVECIGWRGPLSASSKEILDTPIGSAELKLYTCAGGEHRNFLDCVKTRLDPYFPAEIGHRCATVMHMGNIAMLLGRKLRWDPVKEEFLNDETANRMRSRAMREPWSLTTCIA
jgi:predicted dehydrogenase